MIEPASFADDDHNKDMSLHIQREETVDIAQEISPTAEVIPDLIDSDEPSPISLWIHGFFADRPLAKVGGILLFLGALFFLWLIFDTVGPVGKVVLGIAFGFSLLGIGLYLDTKAITTESRVLFGIGIAVNYLTILA